MVEVGKSYFVRLICNNKIILGGCKVYKIQSDRFSISEEQYPIYILFDELNKNINLYELNSFYEAFLGIE